MLLTPAQTEPKLFESRRPFFFLPGVDASHVYVRARALGCFHSLISTKTFRRALTELVDSCTEIKSGAPFSGVTKSGRVWRRVPESDAGSLYHMVTWWWSDRKLVWTEAGLRAQCGTQYSTSQHGTTMWSDHKLVRTEVGLPAQHRTLCFTSLHRSDTWWYGGQIISLWTKIQGLDSKSKLSMELFIPPVNTVPHGWSDGKLLRKVWSSAWNWNSVPPVDMITHSLTVVRS